MSKVVQVLAHLTVGLLIAAVLPSALADDEPIVWFSADAEEGLCESCFEMEFEEAGPSTMLFAPSVTSWRAKPYTPPKWAAGKPNTATWVTTGVIGAGWAYLWADANNTDDDETLKEVGDYTQTITPVAGF